MSETYRGSITLTSISEGRGYGIETNCEKINKFVTDNGVVEYSPDNLRINVYSVEGGTSSTLETSDYGLEIWTTITVYTTVNEVTTGTNYEIGIFNLLNKLKGRPGGSSGTYTNMYTIATDGSTTTSIHFNFANLFNYEIDSNTGTALDRSKFEALLNTFKNENFYFLLKVYSVIENFEPSETNLLAAKPLIFEFGTSEDMANFAITANSIQAAISNTGMAFDANGLTITNGGFKIQKTTQNNTLETVFGFEDNNLYINGSGNFTGTIHATEGDFKGTVNATNLEASAGHIGGFIITDNGLFSDPGDNSSIENANLRLYGINGRVVANTIELGTGATIANYIQLGDAYLYNPKVNSGKLIKAGDVTLTENGIFTVGNITLDGPNSRIYGTNFNITPDLSTFNNVNVTGKITTAVFETGKVQAAGGAMFFKQSYKVEEQNGYVLTLDQDFSAESDHYVYLVNQDGTFLTDRIKVDSVDTNNPKKITLISKPPAGVFSVVDVGKIGDAIIGVNSGDFSIQNVLYPRGFTISELDSNNEISIKAFLGDLSGLNKAGLSGNGLYGENVFLTGSLTTKTNSGNSVSYAGVNTLSGATATKFNGDHIAKDTSEIIFWAGSKGINAEQIQESPFQVTRNGSLYSNQGIFEGAIITRSEIRGVDVYAARIHGEGSAPNPGLSFYNIANGIAFFNGDYGASAPNEPKQTFHIGSNGFAYGTDENYFITINGNIVNAALNEAIIGNLQVTSNYIRSNAKNPANIKLTTDVEILDGAKNSISINNSLLELKHKETSITDVLTLGSKLQYKKATSNDKVIGYNLYVI